MGPALALTAVVIGSPGAITNVAAVDGWTAWSERPRGALTFSLVVVSPVNAVVSRPAVAPRGVPFDLDGGVDARGRAVLTYSRCRTEPAASGGANPGEGGGAPQYTSGSGCTLRILDLRTGRERRVPKAAQDASEVLPSLHGRTLAYVAVRKRGGLRRAVLMTRDMRTGRRTQLFTGARRRGPPATAQGPTSVDTDGVRVASAWRHRNTRDGTFDSDVLVQRLSAQRPTIAASATNTEDTPYVTAFAPTLEHTRVHYLITYGNGFCERRFVSDSRAPDYGIQRSGLGLSPVSGVVDGARLVVADPEEIIVYPEGRFSARPDPGQVCG